MKIEAITQAAPTTDIPAPFPSKPAPLSMRTTGKAKTEVKRIPVRKKPNSTAGPDFSEENIPSSAQLAASIIGSGENNMKGTTRQNNCTQQHVVLLILTHYSRCPCTTENCKYRNKRKFINWYPFSMQAVMIKPTPNTRRKAKNTKTPLQQLIQYY